MGFNTVAFVLNDFSDDLQKSPKTTADIIAYAPSHSAYRDGNDDARRYAEHNHEEPPHPQAIHVEAFHADDTHWYRAGQNTLAGLAFKGYTTRDGKPCVVLEIPEWAAPRTTGKKKS